MLIPFNKTSTDEKEANAVRKVLKSGWITSGPKVKEFEEQFAKYVGAKYAIAVNSCTTGLILALKCSMYSHSEEIPTTVIVPSLTFAATAEAIVNAGMSPYFVEGKELHKIDPEEYDGAVTVHLYGEDRRFRLPGKFIVEDSAHRVEKDQMKDNPNIVVFSFYATKNMTTGEGGMVCTNNKYTAEKIRLMIFHGIRQNAWTRTKNKTFQYGAEVVGWKGNMSDIQAAIGLEQLKKLPKFAKRRNEIVAQYNQEFAQENTGNHLYPLKVKNQKYFLEKMKKDGIQCSVHYYPLHLMPAYKDYLQVDLSVTEEWSKTHVSIPLYPSLTDRQVNYIIKCAKKYWMNI